MKKTRSYITITVWILLLTAVFALIAAVICMQQSAGKVYTCALAQKSYILSYLNEETGKLEIPDIRDTGELFAPFVVMEQDTDAFVYGAANELTPMREGGNEKADVFINAARSRYADGRKTMVIDGTLYYVQTELSETGKYRISQFLPVFYWFKPVGMLGMLFVFICAAILVTLYTLYLKQEKRPHPGRSRVFAILVITLVGMLVAQYFSDLLVASLTNKEVCSISDYLGEVYATRLRSNAIRRGAELGRREQEADKAAAWPGLSAAAFDTSAGGERMVYRYTDANGDTAFALNIFGEQTCCIRQAPVLIDIAEEFGCTSVKLYDSNARCVASSNDEWFSQITDPTFRDVLDRKTDRFSGVMQTGSKTVTVEAVPVLIGEGDGGREQYGMLVLNYPCPATVLTDEAVVMDTIRMVEAVTLMDFAYFDTDEAHTPVYISSAFHASDAEELELDDEVCFDGKYLGTAKIEDSIYFVRCEYIETGYFNLKGACYIAYFVKDFSNTVSIVMAPLVFLLLLLLNVPLRRIDTEQACVLSDSKIHLPSRRDVFSDTDEAEPLSAEGKITHALRVMADIVLAGLYLYTAIIFAKNDRYSVVNHIFSGDWKLGLNYFSLTAILLMVFGCVLFLRLIRIMFSMIVDSLNQQTKTVCRLIVSILTYTAVIACLFLSLRLLGMNVKAVLTSLGAFSLLIGLGAQSLIKDVIAGFFIVMENQFRIGDSVTIGSYKGTVVEIGIRSCKFEYGGDIKSISNSSINDVINRSRKASTVTASVYISNAVPVDTVREAFESELSGITERHSKLIGPIRYLGPTNVGNDYACVYSVGLKGKCAEKDRQAMSGALLEEALKIASDHGFLAVTGEERKSE